MDRNVTKVRRFSQKNEHQREKPSSNIKTKVNYYDDMTRLLRQVAHP